MMKNEEMEAFYSQLRSRDTLDIENHCRKIHGEAIVSCAMLLMKTPMRLFRSSVVQHSGKERAGQQSQTFKQTALPD